MKPNQLPEQLARDTIDKMLVQAGWVVQEKDEIDFFAGEGVAIKEYPTDSGNMDYALFIRNGSEPIPVGVIEAKKREKGKYLLQVTEQARRYANSNLKNIETKFPLPFIYVATGEITRFCNDLDPRPRTREIFHFHRPETLKIWNQEKQNLLQNLEKIPQLEKGDLRDCQFEAIQNLEKSLQKGKSRALMQMATGSGKTYTAITSIYRLLKHARARRVLFLVDTKNLGVQAEQEFQNYQPYDDSRKFTELYSVHRLQESFIPSDSQVYISTIQRLYSILKGKPLEDSLEQKPLYEWKEQEPKKVGYHPKIPVEFFDFIIIDECHRSIYNTWRQVIEYFDANLVGLTATPDNRAYSFFEKNVVSEYSHEKAVADGVNVAGEVYIIKTKIGKEGVMLKAQQLVEKREHLTHKKRWVIQQEDETYTAKDLDKKVVSKNQIRQVIRTFKNALLTEIFPHRTKNDNYLEVPKTLIFAKNDNHATDIIEIVRKEFNEGDKFCEKITYSSQNAGEKLRDFRNSYFPRIAVTVDMIATGTDVKPLECLIFMRDVKSANYFEQMKGRGTRTLTHEQLQQVTPSAKECKTHYVIVDAIGVTESIKNFSPPLITKPQKSLADLIFSISIGEKDIGNITTLVGKLSRIQHKLTDPEKEEIKKHTKGKSIPQISNQLLDSIDPDKIEQLAKENNNLKEKQEPTEEQLETAREQLFTKAQKLVQVSLGSKIQEILKRKEQTIDHDTLDETIQSGWKDEGQEKDLIQDFQSYLEQNKDKIEALKIFYSEPHRRKEITEQKIQELLDKIKSEKPYLAPMKVWEAYKNLDKAKSQNPVNQLTALISLVRRVCGIDKKIENYSEIVKRNFQQWIFQKHSGNKPKFNGEQMKWLEEIRDHIAKSFHISRENFEYTPFDSMGGLGKFHIVFEGQAEELLAELNQELAA